MKTRINLTLLMLFLTAGSVFSQKTSTGKQQFFADYPASIEVSSNILQNAFSAVPGSTVSIPFSNQFIYSGTVLSNEVKYANLQSVIIKSAAFGNALFQISKIINDDKSITYTGRIVHHDALDGYELKKDNNNNYRIQKFETNKVLQDCSF